MDSGTRSSVVDQDTYRRLLRSRDWLAEAFSERVQLKDAARHANLSPFHFQRLFARAFQESPHAFVQRRRLEHAKQLLIAGEEPVTDVCLTVGYESLGSFSTLFRSRYGCSPLEYRRHHQRFWQIPWPRSHRLIPTCFLQRFYGLVPQDPRSAAAPPMAK
jgi:AraC-like DNA-binding protein